MKRLRHPNLVALVDVIDDAERDQYTLGCDVMCRIYMIIEYVENGQVMYYDPASHHFTSKLTSLQCEKSLRVDGVLPEDHAKKYLYDIVSGLQYLHMHKVVHRDIKPENILISKDDHCKISFLQPRGFLTADRRLWRGAHLRDAQQPRPGVGSPFSFPLTRRHQPAAVHPPAEHPHAHADGPHDQHRRHHLLLPSRVLSGPALQHLRRRRTRLARFSRRSGRWASRSSRWWRAACRCSTPTPSTSWTTCWRRTSRSPPTSRPPCNILVPLRCGPSPQGLAATFPREGPHQAHLLGRDSCGGGGVASCVGARVDDGL